MDKTFWYLRYSSFQIATVYKLYKWVVFLYSETPNDNLTGNPLKSNYDSVYLYFNMNLSVCTIHLLQPASS